MQTGIREIALALTTLLVFCAGLELASRWLAPTPIPDPLVTQDQERWAETHLHDPVLFWRLRPSVVLDGAPFTNRLGLRWPEVEPKREDEFRILSLGESTTFARRIGPAQNYSARLAAELGTVRGRRVVVVNAGVPGYSLLQGYNYLRFRGEALEPDAVLIYFGRNDFLPVGHRRKRESGNTGGATDRETFERSRRPVARALSFLMQRSNLVRALVFRGGGGDAVVEVVPGRVRVPEADRRWILDELLDYCRARRIELVIAVPWYHEFREHAPLLREFAAEHGLPLADLPAQLAELPMPVGFYFSDGVHPNALGHQRIAEVIAAVLRERWPR